MKIFNYVSIKFVMLAIAASFAASLPMQAQEAKSRSATANSYDNARLVVARAANFGTLESVNLFVDGVQVADLGLNESYDAVLPPGRHVLSISTNPYNYVPRPTQRRVNAQPGQTYAFTAVWTDSERATLED
jgi:hypothetical protein